MFFDKRRRYNGDVAALLPAFGIDMQESGVFKLLNVLDTAWAKDFSVYEAALLVAYSFAGGLNKHGHPERADALLKDRLLPIQDDWIKKGLVRATLVQAWPAAFAAHTRATPPQNAQPDPATPHGGSQPIARKPDIPRNAPCPCGSGRRFKQCCGQLR